MTGMPQMNDGHGVMKPIQLLLAEPFSFLWIGKTGGNSVRYALRKHNRFSLRVRFVVESHHCKLSDLPPHRKYFFSVRDPIDRFFSAFYSRRREGRPKNHAPHSRAEAHYFSIFEHANDLAEALNAGNALEREAHAALQAIDHINSRQVGYFGQNKYILSQRPPAFILRQAHLEQDLENFFLSLGLGKPRIPTDPVVAHINPARDRLPKLSRRGRANLANVFSDDIEFYKRAISYGQHMGWFREA